MVQLALPSLSARHGRTPAALLPQVMSASKLQTPKNRRETESTVWYVGQDGKEWDGVFRSTFGAPKTDGTRCFTGRIFGDFSFRLTPGTTCSTSVEHKIRTSPSPSSSSLFPSEGIFAPSPFRSIPSAYQMIP
ncbi:hypothetical protein DVH24_023674 [Malus domestica]|uniref:Uncharacterized protein n=1 Tax=Malus domestica TaxID=3750 RepID=A0A498I2K8_MALDO|nr:hypothetical protein DVH24_023674 [Malus domestica]